MQLQPTERLSCQICDSGEDATCEGSPSASALCLLHTPNQQCITLIDLLGNTQRGCSASVECESSNPKKCEVCSGDDCNTGNLKRLEDGQPGLWGQNLPLSCQSCSDATSCAASDLSNTTCSSNSDYCVTVFSANGSVSAKGCSQEVEQTWSSYCDANAGSCHNCNSNGCNSARSLDSYTECIYCDYENEDCATNAANVKSRRLCNGQCFTGSRRRSIENFIYDIVRGCLDDKDPEDQAACIAGTDAACIACSGANCNVDNISEISQSCYKCSGSDCDDPKASQCSQYSPDDRCYILFDYNADITGMGCLSDLDEEYVDENFHSLLFCDDNDCNFFDILPTPHECIVCDSSEDPNCATDPSKITLIGNCGVLPYTSCQTRIISEYFLLYKSDFI